MLDGKGNALAACLPGHLLWGLVYLIERPEPTPHFDFILQMEPSSPRKLGLSWTLMSINVKLYQTELSKSGIEKMQFNSTQV